VQPEESAKPSRYKRIRPTLFVILVLGIIGLGLLLRPLFSDDGTGGTQADAATTSVAPIKLDLYQAQISISSRGFTPSRVTVKSGDSVAWVHKDRSMHLVVSDSGPANFKGQGALQFSDMFLTTFYTAGTYTYYDQLNPSLKGTIIVE
jgi:plastocyanin